MGQSTLAQLDGTLVTLVLGGATLLGLVLVGVFELRGARKTTITDVLDRDTWRMPPLTLLEPVTWSPGTRLGMIALRSYLVVGALLLVVKAIQLRGR